MEEIEDCQRHMNCAVSSVLETWRKQVGEKDQEIVKLQTDLRRSREEVSQLMGRLSDAGNTSKRDPPKQIGGSTPPNPEDPVQALNGSYEDLIREKHKLIQDNLRKEEEIRLLRKIAHRAKSKAKAWAEFQRHPSPTSLSTAANRDDAQSRHQRASPVNAISSPAGALKQQISCPRLSPLQQWAPGSVAQERACNVTEHVNTVGVRRPFPRSGSAGTISASELNNNSQTLMRKPLGNEDKCHEVAFQTGKRKGPTEVTQKDHGSPAEILSTFASPVATKSISVGTSLVESQYANLKPRFESSMTDAMSGLARTRHSSFFRRVVDNDRAVSTRDVQKTNQPSQVYVDADVESTPRTRQSADLGTLQEINSNARKPPKPPTVGKFLAKKRKLDMDRGAVAIPAISGDGEEHPGGDEPSPEKTKKKKASLSPGGIAACRRLNALLTEPSPSRYVLARPPPATTTLMQGYLAEAQLAATTEQKARFEALCTSQEKTWAWYKDAKDLLQSVGAPYPPHRSTSTNREEQKGVQRPPVITSTSTAVKSSPVITSKCATPARPEDHEPCRSRPINRLSLSDFKVNPAFNGGLDYAYKETIRNRGDRKCLPGCLRECCRDKFRALASNMTDLPASHGRPLASKEADGTNKLDMEDEMLIAFLGPNTTVDIEALTPIARENLLLEAKTKSTADRYGKMHRQSYERAESPPGFWRTEMPGTQEEERDRRDALEREREEVKRRWKEAQREDGMGRWLFADE